ncbi:hypothetical protein ACFE04_001209 [Oxalis oulophora]
MAAALALIFLLLVTVSSSFASSPRKIPRLGVSPRLGVTSRHGESTRQDDVLLKAKNNGFKTFYYKQTIDHFNFKPESYATFKQRYVVKTDCWGVGKHSPILVYLGEESAIDGDLENIGFLTENAPNFGALVVYIEHRFYGKSVPFGSHENALRNATLRGYFNSAQALADYAEVILHVKKQFKGEKSPVIVIGGSYGGMLAAWFRLKYPHIATGALASSAPVLYFDNITPSDEYYRRVTKDFKDVSHSCYKTIKHSWSEIDRVAAQPNGLVTLSKKFRTCKTLKDPIIFKDFLDTLYSSAAQYDRHPDYPVSTMCRGMDGGKLGKDILGRVASGVAAYYGANSTCYNISQFFPDETLDGWGWQSCSDMVIPIGHGYKDTMFPAAPFLLKEYEDACKATYGVLPRPHWTTTYYGGHRMREVLKRFGSNIIFSNGLRDPYSGGGVLEDISDTIVAIKTKKGSHCLDIVKATRTDPEWLVLQRKIEIQVINSWLLKYYQDLLKGI